MTTQAQPALFETQDEKPAPAKQPVVKKTKAPPAKAAKPKGAQNKTQDGKKGETVGTAKGTAVAIHQPQGVADITNAMSMLAFIGRAAQDPSVDPAKMSALVDVQERLANREARREFDADFLKLAKEIATIRITKRGMITIFGKNDPEHKGRPIQSTPYAKYDDLNRIIRPILHRHGFTLRHANATSAAGKPVVKTTLVHKGGHSEQSEFEGEIDASGSKNNVQGRGSTISYGKRYNTVSLLDIITDEDDDGRQGKDDPITQDQLARLIEVCEDHGVDKRRFCEHLKIQALADLPARRYDEAVAAAKSKAKPAKGGEKWSTTS